MDYLDRLKAEAVELLNKMNKLNEFLHSDTLPSMVGEEEIALLELQYSCMEGYLKVLNRRLKLGEQK